MLAFSLQFSEPELESDEEVAPETHVAAGLATEVGNRAEKMASSSSVREEEENVNVMNSDATTKGKQIAPRVTRTIRTLQTAAPI